jgi:hypothetical protein
LLLSRLLNPNFSITNYTMTDKGSQDKKLDALKENEPYDNQDSGKSGEHHRKTKAADFDSDKSPGVKALLGAASRSPTKSRPTLQKAEGKKPGEEASTKPATGAGGST